MHRTRLSNRLQGYDYSRNALYFVTSCMHNRLDYFGEIKDNQMFLNEYGKIAELQLRWLEQQYPYIVLHSFVVMPNHIHGIIEIDDRMVPVGPGRNVGTGRDLSLQSLPIPQIPQQPITKIKSLSELMGAYKTTTSKRIHLLEKDTLQTVITKPFKWQRSFHDHIIRNEESYLRISNYIQNNPKKWREDKFYT